MILVPTPRKLRLTSGVSRCKASETATRLDTQLPAESYRLEISADRITITHSDAAGLQHARQKLLQIEKQNTDTLPCLEIEDSPVLRERCFMLDISRCKVPTMESLFRIIDLLAALKMNQFQLYMEHTFAYQQHETVWKEASPLTAEDIQALDKHCQSLNIELIPNQNSIGHMERWLQHSEYQHLAECPEGFVHPVDGKRRPYGSTLKPNQASADFMGELYDELLPNFSSNKFNIGGDEPWELGTGWSANQAAKLGKGQLYIAQLKRIVKLAHKHNSEALYWADGMLKHPELITEAPENACPVIWGYETDHPFTEQCELIASTGKPFYLAPGDSTWNSFTGRLHIARINIPTAARMAEQYQARGIIHTHWGDNGHPQTWPIALPGLILAASSAWNPSADIPDIGKALDTLVYCDTKESLGKATVALSEVDEALGAPLSNSSLLFKAAHESKEDLQTHLAFVTDKAIAATREKLEEAQLYIQQAKPHCKDAGQLIAEHQLSHDMAAYALNRLSSLKNNQPHKNQTTTMQAIKTDYNRVWLQRNKPGGLDESLSRYS